MSARNSVAAVFDEAAPTYDAVGVPLFEPVARRLVAELAPAPGARALDVGCGRGAVLWPLLDAVGPGGRVVGVDLSAGMIRAARDEAGRRPAPGVTAGLAVADATTPPFPPGSFDVVTSSLVLFFLPDPGPAVRAWRELLAEGGQVGVTSFGAYSQHWSTVEEVLERWRSPSLRDARTTGRRGPFASAEGMEQLLAGAGLEQVRTVTMWVPLRFTDGDHWFRWTQSTGQRAMWASIPDDRRDEVRAEVYRRIEAAPAPGGRLGFDQEVRLTLGRR